MKKSLASFCTVNTATGRIELMAWCHSTSRQNNSKWDWHAAGQWTSLLLWLTSGRVCRHGKCQLPTDLPYPSALLLADMANGSKCSFLLSPRVFFEVFSEFSGILSQSLAVGKRKPVCHLCLRQFSTNIPSAEENKHWGVRRWSCSLLRS